MPRKPIKPDRVRTPSQWWRARLTNVGGNVLTFAVIVVGTELYTAGYDVWLILPTVLGIVLAMLLLVVSYETIVYRAWVTRVLEHDGFMCPQCTYTLQGILQEHTSVTCPECGYLTEDTSKLFERWRKTMKRFYLQEDKRLRNRTYRGPRT